MSYALIAQPILQHPQQHFPYRRIGTRAYNGDNRRGVAGVVSVADVGLQLTTSPGKGSKGPEHRHTDTFQSFEGAIVALLIAYLLASRKRLPAS